MADLIIKNATIISVDAERRVIDKGIIEITGNQITAVHDTIGNGMDTTGAEVIDATGMIALRGLLRTSLYYALRAVLRTF